MNVTAPAPGTNITMLHSFQVDIIKMVSTFLLSSGNRTYNIDILRKAKNPVQIDIAIQIDAISHKDGVPRNLYNGTFTIAQEVPPTAMINVVPDNLPKGPATLNITHYYIAGVGSFSTRFTVALNLILSQGDPTVETESFLIPLQVVG